MRIRGFSPAVRVAAVATAAIAVVYVIGAIVLNLVVAQHMTQQNDDQLGDRLTVARHHPDTLRQRVAQGDASSDIDADGAPVFLWAVNSRRAVVAHSPGAPALPPALLTARARKTVGAAGPCSPRSPTGPRSPVGHLSPVGPTSPLGPCSPGRPSDRSVQ